MLRQTKPRTTAGTAHRTLQRKDREKILGKKGIFFEKENQKEGPRGGVGLGSL